jgi:drug/metabolite transporter (DMT)-like permease
MDSHRFAGIFLALVSAVFFALANTLAGVAYTGGSNPFTLSATRFILPALFLILLPKGKAIALERRPAIVAALLGVISVAYTFALLKAIELLPVSIAILIFYLFPILTAFILAALGAGRLTAKTLTSALIVFAGLGLALAVKFNELNTVGMMAGLVSAVGFAIVCSVSNRLMSDQDSRTVTLYLSAAATVAMIVVSCLNLDNVRFPVTASGWSALILSNVLYAAAIIGFYRSIAMVGAGAATFFLNLEPIVVIATGYVVLDQMISSWQMVGVAIVVAALISASQPEGRGKLGRPPASPSQPHGISATKLTMPLRTEPGPRLFSAAPTWCRSCEWRAR